MDMKLVKRVVNYFNTHHSTVRKTAEAFGISESIVYKYLTVVMPNETSKKILEANRLIAHINGGETTKANWILKNHNSNK